MAYDPDADRTGGSFLVGPEHPCPVCGEAKVLGYYLVDERGRHQHTRYVCTFWRSGISPAGFAAYRACGWTGWTVPAAPVVEADEVEIEFAALGVALRGPTEGLRRLAREGVDVAPLSRWERLLLRLPPTRRRATVRLQARILEAVERSEDPWTRSACS